MKIVRKGIINTVAAASANLKEDATAKQNVICDDNTADPLVEVLPPIPYGEKYSVTSEVAVVEVRQLVLVGKNVTSDSLETVVAGRKYKVILDNIFDKFENEKKSQFVYGYTAPITLSGSAATDRYNMYYKLVTDINSRSENNVAASLVQAVPFITGSTAAPAVGSTVTQTGSTYTGVVADVVITSGTFAGNNAAGTMYLYNNSNTFTAAGGNYTYTGGTAVNNGAGVAGQAMTILDDAGYWTPLSQPSSLSMPAKVRTGATGVYISDYNADGSLSFETAEVEIVRAAVYSKGVGADMAKWIPYFHYTGLDVMSGSTDYIFNTTVDSTKYYSRVIITTKTSTDGGAVGAGNADYYKTYELYLAQDSSTVQGVNPAALIASIVAMS